MLFLPLYPSGMRAKGLISVGASTDNCGNTFSVTKLMTTKFPLVAFVAELATQMEDNSWDLELDWVPRDQNIEADAITNEDFSAFDAGKQIDCDPSKMNFKVLNEMLDLGDAFYAERESAKDKANLMNLPAIGQASNRSGKLRKVCLKESQPW